jgi:hypothetical protein
MVSGKEVQWTIFGISVWIIGIAVLIAGFALSQQRQTIDRRCDVWSGNTCTYWTDVNLELVTPLAIVGYMLAAFGVLLNSSDSSFTSF